MQENICHTKLTLWATRVRLVCQNLSNSSFDFNQNFNQSSIKSISLFILLFWNDLGSICGYFSSKMLYIIEIKLVLIYRFEDFTIQKKKKNIVNNLCVRKKKHVRLPQSKLVIQVNLISVIDIFTEYQIEGNFFFLFSLTPPPPLCNYLRVERLIYGK